MNYKIFNILKREFGSKKAKELMKFYYRVSPFEPSSPEEVIDIVLGVKE